MSQHPCAIGPVVLALMVASCGPIPTDVGTTSGGSTLLTQASETLRAPSPVDRLACGAVSQWPEGPVTLAWEPVERASTYTVEIDCLGCGSQLEPWFSEGGRPWRMVRELVNPLYTSDVAAELRRERGRAMRWRA